MWGRHLEERAAGGEPRRAVEVFDDEAVTIRLAAVGHVTARKVEMQGPHDVDSRIGLEQPELRADPRVEVEELVLAVAAVQSPVEVDDAPVADAATEVDRLRGEARILEDPTARRHPGAHRPRSKLDAGKGDQRYRVPVEVCLEDPILADHVGDELLDDRAEGLGPARAEREQVLA